METNVAIRAHQQEAMRTDSLYAVTEQQDKKKTFCFCFKCLFNIDP